jgi:cell division protein YceG involved in septum cleavage
MKVVNMKVNAIDRITHMGSVRGTEKTINSGIALQTEFQLLNARLSEKADLLENAEETIWSFFAKWQNKVFDGVIDYPDTFDLRDYASDLQFLQMAKASGVKSETFIKEIDKQIARAVVDDDEAINSINNEIDASSTAIGQFSTALPTNDNGEQ